VNNLREFELQRVEQLVQIHGNQCCCSADHDDDDDDDDEFDGDDVGTIFLEVWKRERSTLAYEWDVSSFENSEPDRPQFVGTKETPVGLGVDTDIHVRDGLPCTGIVRSLSTFGTFLQISSAQRFILFIYYLLVNYVYV